MIKARFAAAAFGFALALGVSAGEHGRLLAIGDSITAADKWQHRTGELLGMDVRSHCKGGIGIVHMVDGDGRGEAPAEYDPDTFGVRGVHRLNAKDVTDVDLILLTGFYNERNLVMTERGRGTAKDMYPAQGSFCGRLNYAVKRVREELGKAGNVRAKIALVSPHRYGKYSWIDRTGYEDGEKMVSAIREVAEANGVPFIDVLDRAGIGRDNWNEFQNSKTPFAAAYLTADGTPNSGVNKPFASLEAAPSAAENKGRTITVRGSQGHFRSDGRFWTPQRAPAPWNADQLHLNPAGYRKLGEAIAQEVERLGLVR